MFHEISFPLHCILRPLSDQMTPPSVHQNANDFTANPSDNVYIVSSGSSLGVSQRSPEGELICSMVKKLSHSPHHRAAELSLDGPITCIEVVAQIIGLTAVSCTNGDRARGAHTRPTCRYETACFFLFYVIPQSRASPSSSSTQRS